MKNTYWSERGKVNLKSHSRFLNDDRLPYLIAEIGVNHEGSLERALQLVEDAKSAGADAAKFQVYKADQLAMKSSPAYWDTTEEPCESQFELFSKYDGFDVEEYATIAAHCENIGIDFMATPFDLDSVNFLLPLVRHFKIASADITNVPLLRKVGESNRDIILSTGAAAEEEIDQALNILNEAGAKSVALLHCVLCYPTTPGDANLRMISRLVTRYPNNVIGLSDHTRPTEDNLALVLGFALGAEIIEKHFTDDTLGRGNDHYHSIDLEGMRRLRSSLTRAAELIGDAEGKYPVACESPARLAARRSLVATRDLAAGHVLEHSDLICLRPQIGIPASAWDEVIGRQLRRSVRRNTALTEHDLD